MDESKEIKVCPHDGIKGHRINIPVPCHVCRDIGAQSHYRVKVAENKLVLCESCLKKLHEQIGLALHKTVRIGDTIYHLVECDDGICRIFPMVVGNVCEFGSPRTTRNGLPEVWNVYATGDRTYMYASFYEEGKTWFINETDALAALKNKTKGKNPAEAPELSMSKMLTISARHVTQDLFEELSLDTGYYGLPVYAKTAPDNGANFGLLIYLSSNDIIWDEIPTDLKRLIRLARANGSDILCLASDGMELEDYPVYNWD